MTSKIPFYFYNKGWFQELRKALYDSIKDNIPFSDKNELSMLIRVLAQLDNMAQYGKVIEDYTRDTSGKLIFQDHEAIVWWFNNDFKGLNINYLPTYERIEI